MSLMYEGLLAGFRNGLVMTIPVEEEKVKGEMHLLEMLWKMGEVRRRWNEADGVGGVGVMSWIRCSIFGL